MAVVCSVTILLLAKIWFIQQYASHTPFWDQWDAEATHLYKPWIEGELTLVRLLSAHNEHRIFTTRLLHLGLFELAGRTWNPLLQMGLNAVLHVGAVAVFGAMVSSTLRADLRLMLWVFITFLFLPPFGWENLLTGFQTQFYLLLLLSFGLLWWSAIGKVTPSALWLAATASILLPLTMASGSLGVLAAVVLLTGRRFVWGQRAIPVLFVLLLLAIASVGLAFTPSVPGHAHLKPSSFLEFAVAAGKAAAWPARPDGLTVTSALMPLLAQAPLIAAVAVCWRSGESDRKALLIFGAFAIWFALQVCALAYGRGAADFASRYLDIFAFGVAANFAALLFCWSKTKHAIRLLVSVFALIWFAWVTWSVLSLLPMLRSELAAKAEISRVQENNVRGYLISGDRRWLDNARFCEIPYPSADVLRQLLDDATVRSFLPGKLLQKTTP